MRIHGCGRVDDAIRVRTGDTGSARALPFVQGFRGDVALRNDASLSFVRLFASAPRQK